MRKVELPLAKGRRRNSKKYSTVGRLHPLVPEGFCPLEGEPKGSQRLLKRGLVRKVEPSLMVKKVSVPCKGNRKGLKDY